MRCSELGVRKTVALLLLFLCGCVQSGYWSVVDFPDQTWRADKSATFDFVPTDNSRAQNIDIILRFRPQAEGQRMILVVKTQNERREFWTDTLHVVLSGDSGSAIRSQMIPYRGAVLWPSAKKHSISISTDRERGDMVSIGVAIN